MIPHGLLADAHDVLDILQSLVLKALQRERWCAWGIVTSMDQGTRTAFVQIMPTGEISKKRIPLYSPRFGSNPSILNGAQVLVLLDRSIPLAAIGPFSSDAEPPIPTGLELFEGDIQASGIVRGAHGLAVNPRPVLPPPSEELRGVIMGTGPNDPTTTGRDRFYICCRNDTAGTWVWAQIAEGGA